MRLIFAILVGKLINFLSKKFNIGGGSAAPGLYALSIEPNLVEKLAAKIPQNIIITGTNGKTTTAKMLAHFAKTSGLKVIRNHTGSNLERGIASTLISNYNLLPAICNLDLGIWELDEAAFNTVVPMLKPNIIVFLNVSRDQLDRYGEVDKVVTDWCQTLKKTPSDTTLIINGDDKSLNQLASSFKGKSFKFALPKDIKLDSLNGSSFALTISDKRYTINLPLPGIYHIYDAVAAFSAAEKLKIPFKTCLKSLKTFQPGFGRVEKLPFGYIFLIKNPAGATQVFETIAPNIKPQDRLLLALNDNLADGTDVSWIWDVNFEVLQNLSRAKSRDHTIYISGSRAHDLAIRLKYAGFEANSLNIEPNLKNALKQARMGLKGRLFILPTYTAMLELQSILTKAGIKKHYWKEEA